MSNSAVPDLVAEYVKITECAFTTGSELRKAFIVM